MARISCLESYKMHLVIIQMFIRYWYLHYFIKNPRKKERKFGKKKEGFLFTIVNNNFFLITFMQKKKKHFIHFSLTFTLTCIITYWNPFYIPTSVLYYILTCYIPLQQFSIHAKDIIIIVATNESNSA